MKFLTVLLSIAFSFNVMAMNLPLFKSFNCSANTFYNQDSGDESRAWGVFTFDIVYGDDGELAIYNLHGMAKVFAKLNESVSDLFYVEYLPSWKEDQWIEFIDIVSDEQLYQGDFKVENPAVVQTRTLKAEFNARVGFETQGTIHFTCR